MKRTVVYRDILGNKRVDSYWDDVPGCGSFILVLFVLFLLFRGCS